MPNVNTNKSTSPEGGNVEAHSSPTQTNSPGVTETSAAETCINHQSLSPTNPDLPNTCLTEDTSQKDRDRVIKELGVTSSSFIGPACRPEPPSIEQELSDFYKELEEVDHSDSVDGCNHEEQGQDVSCKPESDSRYKKDSPAAVTNHSRAFKPYPDPQERNGQQRQYGDPKRWRPRAQCGTGNFGRRGHIDPWCPPPPWVPRGPPNSEFQHFPPPSSGSPMYPSDVRPQQTFHTHTDHRNWAPWEGSLFPPNELYDNDRGPTGSYDYSGFSEDHNKPPSYWQEIPEQQYDHREDQYHHHHHHYNSGLHLILLRGLPGSGKSTLARELMSSGPSGTILSTDDYFIQDNTYVFDGTLLSEAHDWNQKRAERVMSEGRSPIIIDNTNVKAWEMKPYVKMAIKNGYKVDFREPETNWKYDPIQLEKRNKHGVPRESIAKMLDRFEWPVNVDIVMNSVEPPHKSRGPKL